MWKVVVEEVGNGKTRIYLHNDVTGENAHVEEVESENKRDIKSSVGRFEELAECWTREDSAVEELGKKYNVSDLSWAMMSEEQVVMLAERAMRFKNPRTPTHKWTSRHGKVLQYELQNAFWAALKHIEFDEKTFSFSRWDHVMSRMVSNVMHAPNVVKRQSALPRGQEVLAAVMYEALMLKVKTEAQLRGEE